MAINLNKPETIPAPLQPHLATFLPLLNKETLIEVVLGLNNDLTAAKQDLTETCLSRDAARRELAAIKIAAKQRSDRDILSELEDGEIISYVAECLPNYMVEALPHVAAMTAEFEEKYYGLDLTNRRLRERLTKLEERFAKVTMSLAQAEAALGIPADDEWDSWSDAVWEEVDGRLVPCDKHLKTLD
jgi:hypothetical protein